MCTLFAHAESFNERDRKSIEEATGTCYKDCIIIVS